MFEYLGHVLVSWPWILCGVRQKYDLDKVICGLDKLHKLGLVMPTRILKQAKIRFGYPFPQVKDDKCVSRRFGQS